MHPIDDARRLFAHELGSLLATERVGLDVLTMLEQRCANDGAKDLLRAHRDETTRQIANVEQAFSAVLGRVEEQPAPVAEALRDEVQARLQEAAVELYDAIALAAAAALEHHEIAAYETLLTAADVVGDEDVIALLQENLDQELYALAEVKRYQNQVAHKLANARKA